MERVSTVNQNALPQQSTHVVRNVANQGTRRKRRFDVPVPDSELWFKYLIPDESKLFLSRSHFVALRLTYPELRENHPLKNDGDGSHAPDHVPENHAVLIVIKPTLTGDEPPDLLARRRMNEGFPNDVTINQFLDPNQFESYVMLGRHIGDELDAWIEGKGEGGLGRIDLSTPACSSEKQQPPG